MSRSEMWRPLGVLFLAAVGIGTVVLAMPVADEFRHALAQRLPVFILVIGTLSAVAHLVSAAVDVLSRSFDRRIIVLRLLFAASALSMVVAFSPVGSGTRPLLVPLSASAILAVAAAAIARRTRIQSNA